MEQSKAPRWVRLSDEAKRAGLHRITLQRWLRAGRIKGFKLHSRLWMVEENAVDILMAELAAEQGAQ